MQPNKGKLLGVVAKAGCIFDAASQRNTQAERELGTVSQGELMKLRLMMRKNGTPLSVVLIELDVFCYYVL